jgi:hypothetical protein
MDGVGSVLIAEGATQRPSGRKGSTSSPGALATSKQAVAEALANTGFINVAGQMSENFEIYLDREPFAIDTANLKPGMLEDLAAQVASELEEAPKQAKQTQARVPPERAVKLLA